MPMRSECASGFDSGGAQILGEWSTVVCSNLTGKTYPSSGDCGMSFIYRELVATTKLVPRWVASTSTLRLLSVVALVIGVGARTFAFCEVPPGLNPDEASIGYDAWSLLHYGVDRNGFKWPIHLVSWGSGQNALYAYFAMPFIAFGLTPCTTRVPMLLAGYLSLPLTWIVARRLFDERAAWTTLGTVALSPWHVMLSRWALESNLMPFVFLAALAGLLSARTSNAYRVRLVCAFALFGLCLYAYGTAYLAVPLFVTGALILGVVGGDLTPRAVALGFTTFLIVTLPIVMYVSINAFGWQTVSLAGITIPRLPVSSRMKTEISSRSFSSNAEDLWRLLTTQSDGLAYNVTEPYGVLYSGAFFIFALCLMALIVLFTLRKQWPARCALVVLWCVVTVPTGVVQEPNINRINLLLMSLVLTAGLALGVIDRWMRGLATIGLLALLLLSGFFIHTYFTKQPRLLSEQYATGFTSALDRAQASSSPTDLICVTSEVNMPYIFALFTERTDPRKYLRTVSYLDVGASIREVTRFGRYTFGLERCDLSVVKAVIARSDERVPKEFGAGIAFGLFNVYLR